MVQVEDVSGGPEKSGEVEEEVGGAQVGGGVEDEVGYEVEDVIYEIEDVVGDVVYEADEEEQGKEAGHDESRFSGDMMGLID